MIFGFRDVSMTPKTDIIYLWRHTKTPRRIPKHLNEKYYSPNSPEFENRPHIFLEHVWGRTNPENPSNLFVRILYMGSIPSREHEMKTR